MLKAILVLGGPFGTCVLRTLIDQFNFNFNSTSGYIQFSFVWFLWKHAPLIRSLIFDQGRVFEMYTTLCPQMFDVPGWCMGRAGDSHTWRVDVCELLARCSSMSQTDWLTGTTVVRRSSTKSRDCASREVWKPLISIRSSGALMYSPSQDRRLTLRFTRLWCNLTRDWWVWTYHMVDSK